MKTMASNDTKQYGWKELSNDLATGNYIGQYGGCNSAWHGMAALRAKTDLKKYHTKVFSLPPQSLSTWPETHLSLLTRAPTTLFSVSHFRSIMHSRRGLPTSFSWSS